jgi:hypothetical protein
MCGTTTIADCIPAWAIGRPLTMSEEPRKTGLSTEPREDPGRKERARGLTAIR